MSDQEEHSESESYYPDELEFLWEQRFDRNKLRTSWREKTKETVKKRLKLSFRSKNTTKKTVSEMKKFQRYLSPYCEENMLGRY